MTVFKPINFSITKISKLLERYTAKFSGMDNGYIPHPAEDQSSNYRRDTQPNFRGWIMDISPIPPRIGTQPIYISHNFSQQVVTDV